MPDMSKPHAVVVLENIRSAHNVGAIFRTAESIGVSKIYLVGYTPAPIDRFGRAQPDIVKTALGADTMVEWEHALSSRAVLEKLKHDGVHIVAVERDTEAIDYKTCNVQVNIAFIFGNEIVGVSKEVLALADEIISLPMNGHKESLNVSVAAGIVLYRLLDRNAQST